MVKLSIVLPVYNVEDYLEDCLNSLINQSEDKDEFEIIAINDGSGDKSYDILREYTKHLPNLKIYNQKNSGLSATRNRGIELSTGKYIYFLDSDDMINNDTVKKINNITKESDLDMLLFGGKSFIDGNNEKKVKQDDFQKNNKYPQIMQGTEAFMTLISYKDYTASVCLYAIRKNFLIENNLYFPADKLNEDEIFTFLSILKSSNIKVISDELFYRRIRENSIMTGMNFERRLEGYYYNLIEMVRYRDSLNLAPSSKLYKYINIKTSHMYGGALNNYIYIKDKHNYIELINKVKNIGVKNNFFDRLEYKLFHKSELMYSILRKIYQILK